MADIPDPYQQPTSEDPVEDIHRAYVRERDGRVRNARIALAAVVALLLSVSLNIGSVTGWFSATRALDTRNRAVVTLTNSGIRQAKIDSCQDQAFAAWLDGVLEADDIAQGVLAGYYDTCQVTDGKTFRR